MPVHDWTRTDAATFHAFHTAWITHLSEALNGGLLPSEYYALPEHRMQDVLTLHSPQVETLLRSRTVAIHHFSEHRLVSLIEIVAPENKERRIQVEHFVSGARMGISGGVHLLVADLLPPGKHDPAGIHGAIWERFDDEPYAVPQDQSLTLASYTAGAQPTAYVEHLSPGQDLVEMPLFLNADRYINVPMNTTYQIAFHGLPAFLRHDLEQTR